MRSFIIIISFFLTFIASTTTVAAVFTVTSNADSGIGTLRQALLDAAANGSTEKDFIHFNIANQSEAGRTIAILTLLPDVSSNLVIDGSTQPGLSFGVSSSKVCLNFILPALQSNNILPAIYVSHVDDVEIYGLYLKNGLQNKFTYLYGIKLENNNNIKIGAAGKGNVFFGFTESISTGIYNHQTTFCKNLTLKGNFMDIDADGQTIVNEQRSGAQIFALEGQAEIGGTPAEGNIFAFGLLIYQSNPASINFKNNKVGVNYTTTKSFLYSTGMRLWGISDGDKTNCNIEDNIICAGNVFNALNMHAISYPVKVVRNYIGIDKTLQNKLATSELAITLRFCSQVFIGSNNPADANYITGCKPLYVWENSIAAVNKNSFFCTIAMYPTIEPGAHIPITQIAITGVTANKVSGTATPNSSIELFYSDNCGTTCAPQTYFASTTADANGAWEYTGVILGPVIASATFNNSTSEFTNPRINRDNIVITNTCNGKGSIKGAEVSGAANIKWVNEHGTTVGTSVDLENAPAGKYKLIVNNGDCGDATDFYEIEDGSLKINTTQMQLINASCGNANGKTTGITYAPSNISEIVWTNSAGTVVGTYIDLVNVPAGNYFLTIKSDNGTCNAVYGPVNIANSTGPNINQSSANITPTNCGQSIGSINGITATGIGILKYSWKNEQQQEVGTSAALLNQPAGKYNLLVTDGSTCGPVYTTAIEIPQVNGIVINESLVQITVAGCKSDGAISGISAPGATTYKWTDVNNLIVGNNIDLQGVAAGFYTLTASNSFGCMQIKSYQVGQKPATVYPDYQVSIINACNGTNNGSITVSTSGLAHLQRWTNSQDATVGSGKFIDNLFPATYKLYLTDVDGCESFYKSYSVAEAPILTPPLVNNVKVCTPGKAIISVNKLTTGFRYRLYESENSANPLDEQPDGRFTIDVKNNTQYFVSQITGVCESMRAPVNVTVGISALDITNTFTPNGDGINDYWKIIGIENSPNATVQVFNRVGQTVFNARGYSTPFDGVLNGTHLPTGTYYYIINMGAACGVLSGAITIVR